MNMRGQPSVLNLSINLTTEAQLRMFARKVMKIYGQIKTHMDVGE
jgi:hypothetical protein